MIADMDQPSGPDPAKPKKGKPKAKAKQAAQPEPGEGWLDEDLCKKCQRLDEITGKLWRVHPMRAQIAQAFHQWLDAGLLVVTKFDTEQGMRAWTMDPGTWEW